MDTTTALPPPEPELTTDPSDDIESRIARLPIPFELLVRGLSCATAAPPLMELGDDEGGTDGRPEDLAKQGITTVFTKLSLPAQGLTDLSFLKNFKYIQRLELPGNGISNVEPLSHLPNLVHLDLSNNKLTSVLEDIRCVSPSQTIPALESLDLSRNQIQRIGDLSRHKYLKRLSLERNLIMSIEGLEGCKFLGELRLGHNGISKITGLDDLPLKKLDMRWNRLTCLSGLSRLHELTHLIAPHNAVSSLSSLAGCSNTNPILSHLDLAHNLLSDVAELSTFKDATSLRSLVLKGNPITGRGEWEEEDGESEAGSSANQRPAGHTPHGRTAASSSSSSVTLLPNTRTPSAATLSPSKPQSDPTFYRLFTIFVIPHITSLDNRPVTPEDKVAAVNRFDPPSEVRDAVLHAEWTAKQAKLYARVLHNDMAEQRGGRLRPIVLCGPSGVGKRTIAAQLAAEYPHVFGLAVSHTTRRPRPGEEDGVHYRFVPKMEMEEMVERGEFVESVTLFGNMYGTSVGEVDRVAEEGKICVMSVEVEGIAALSRSNLRPRYVYVTAPNIEVISTRLQHRQRTMNSARLSKSQMQTNFSAFESAVEDNPRTDSAQGHSPDHLQPGSLDNEILQWIENAQRSVASAQSIGMDFFDLVVVNDDVNKAYLTFRDFALKACRGEAVLNTELANF
ncbi:P-loop containing nucleoside triphosphate hydrolase protein [Gonapodya prolifera JEL478]|uniref:p-loop containing nucleoside triphosphate hydrolase protein n=1 Tax=Gonapodya prolifera (strain JEL478) TaxID=1344416 RepID=A0A139ATP6_GONPJ|nr:P-loop containing nucleoside triphosphate hydrolase protein [Gonapodya prolifera JEL478]|eukprot:KXS19943.1 P-loop containing nucleoside triphosphate hydrolase protein [Gonapodya prolifera JEL478]